MMESSRHLATEEAELDRVKRRFLQGAAAATGTSLLGAAGGARAADRDKIRIGYVSAKTGPFSPFTEADDFIVSQVRDVVAKGITIGGKTYEVEILVRDDQSDGDRQSNLAAELINKDNVDLMLALATVGPGLSRQCEINGVPCVTTMTPWQAWMFPLNGEPSKGFKYNFHFFWGIEDLAAVYTSIWRNAATNSVVGTLYTNDVPGRAMGDMEVGVPGLLKQSGYKIVDVGKYPSGTDDFSAFIKAFKRDKVEIVTGLCTPPEFATFLNQSSQMGYHPKVCTVAKALLFPSGVAALGKRAEGMSTEVWWLPSYPFKSSLTGQSAHDFAAAYTQYAKKEWTQPMGVVHALFEIGIQALKASGDPKSPTKVSDALRGLQMDTILGRIDFKGSGIKNVSKIRVVGGQWHLNANSKPELFVIANTTAPEIPVQRSFEALQGI